jgi:hypothetical protein
MCSLEALTQPTPVFCRGLRGYPSSRVPGALVLTYSPTVLEASVPRCCVPKAPGALVLMCLPTVPAASVPTCLLTRVLAASAPRCSPAHSSLPR